MQNLSVNNLQIEGNRIILPKTWQHHNQARIILFDKDDLKFTEKVTPREFSDLPTITCDIGVSRPGPLNRGIQAWHAQAHINLPYFARHN